MICEILKSTGIYAVKELTHWKRLWCWEGLGAGGEGNDRGWDGWMASLTRWMWVWVNSGSWWWTGRPGELRFMGSQRVGHDWATELNWTEPLDHSRGIFWFFFNWKIIALQSCVGFCHTTWISHKYMCIYTYMHKYVCVCCVLSCSVISDSLQPHGL